METNGRLMNLLSGRPHQRIVNSYCYSKKQTTFTKCKHQTLLSDNWFYFLFFYSVSCLVCS